MLKLKKLKNGLNLLVVPIKGTRAITVLSMFPVGSRYEDKKLSGASHFVEHLMFKGTSKRPTAMDIARELDAVGAKYNAFTDKDYTGYYIKISGENQRLAYDILSDMLFNSKFDDNEIKREKGVIIEEMRMYEDNPLMAVDALLDKVLFGDHPLGWDIIGNHKSITEITGEQLRDYYKQAYQSKNATLVVAGAVTPSSLRMIEEYFGGDKNTISKKKVLKEDDFKKFVFKKTSLSLSDRVLTGTRKIDQAQLMLGFPGLKYTEKQKDAMAVLVSLLSGGMSSRLFVEVREKRGLAYMIRAGHISFRDTGTFYVQAGLDPIRLREALDVIKSELKKISTNLVEAKELKDAKNSLLGRLTLSMEDSDSQAGYFAKNLIFLNKVTSPEKYGRRIKKVSALEVKNLAKKIFKEGDMRIAVISSLTRERVLDIIR